MMPEERFTNLENAFDTLARLAVQTKSRTDSLSDLVTESKSQTESLIQQTETLIQLVRDHDERMTMQLTWLNQLGEAQANADFKIAALADAQIKTEAAQANSEAKIAALADAQRRTEASLVRLSDAQADSDRKLGELIHIVRKGLEDRS